MKVTDESETTEATASLERARIAVEAGDKSFKRAAEHLATAKRHGSTQRQMAEAVGKSPAWVNRLLKWREAGFPDETPFAASSRPNGNGSSVQHAERESIWDDDDDESIGSSPEETDDDQLGSIPKAQRAKRSPAQGRNGSFDSEKRDELIEALNGLGSMGVSQRARAALKASQIRKSCNLSWDELLVSAKGAMQRAA